MKDILEVFEKDTDAIATNKGFYYQYLYTVEEWLKVYLIGDKDTKIFCEYEDDIRGEQDNYLEFKQIKCYKSALNFSSPKVKESMYNNFINSLKYTTRDLHFVFVTNQESKDLIILNWESYKVKNFAGNETNTVLQIKNDIIEASSVRKDSKINALNNKKRLSITEKKKLIGEVRNAFKDLEKIIDQYDWVSFCKRISFKYDGKQPNIIKEELIEKLITKVICELPAELIFSRILQEVIEKSSNENIDDRILTCDLFKLILEENEEQAKQKISESSLLTQNTLNMLSLLSDIKGDTTCIKSGICKLEANDKQMIDLMQKVLASVDNKNINSPMKVNEAYVTNILPTEEYAFELSNMSCDKLYEIVIEKIDKLIDDGKLSAAELAIKELIKSDECPLYPEKFVTDLKFKLGIVYINSGNLDGAKDILEDMKIAKDSKPKFKYMSLMACFLDDEDLLSVSLVGLTKCNVEKTEITIEKTKFDLHRNNFQNVISRLATNGQIKEEYLQNYKLFEQLGIAYLELGNLDVASDCFRNAIKLKENSFTRFLLILCQVEPITARVGSIYLLSQEEKISLNDKYKELQSIEGFFKETNLEDYWRLRLAILLFVDVSKMQEEFEGIPEKFKSSINVRLLMADRLSILDDDGAFDALKEIYSLHQDPEILIKIVSSLMVKRRFKDVISLLDEIELINYDSQGRIAGLYLEAVQHSNGVAESLNESDRFIGKFLNAPFFYLTLAKLFFENKDIENTKKNLRLMKDTLVEENYPPRLLMAEYCEKLGFLDLAIDVIEPLAAFSLSAKKLFIDYLINTGEPQKIEKANNTLDSLIQSDVADFEMFALKAKVEFDNEHYETAFELLKKSFSLKKTPTVAYNLILAKIKLHNLDEIEEAIRYLSMQDNPKFQIFVAGIYKKLGRNELGEYHSLKALALLGETFDEDTYSKFIALHLISNEEQKEIVELDRVVNDSAVELYNLESSQELWVCLHSEKDLANEQFTKFAGCEHYHIESKMGILLRNKKKDDVIQVEGNVYKIAKILPRKVVIIQFCLAVFPTKFPDSKFLKAIEIPENDPITPLLPFLTDMRSKEDFVLRQYNFENGIGLPLYTVAGYKYSHYLDTITKLLGLKNQLFYTGEANLIEKYEDTKLVMTLSTLIVLNLCGCLEHVNKISSILYIPVSLKNLLNDIFDQCEKLDMRTVGTMGLDEFSKPVFFPISEEQKENRLDFWRNIVLFIKDGNINIEEDFSNPIQDGYTNNLRRLVGNVDLNCILLAKKLNAYLVVDDLFIRKAAGAIGHTVSSNCASFLSCFINDLDVLLNSFLKLSEGKYHFLLSEEIILQITKQIALKPIIYGEGTQLGKIKMIIRNVLSNPVIFNNYLKLLISLLDKLYDLKIHAVYHEVIVIILSELIYAGNSYNLPTKVFENLIVVYVRIHHKFDLTRERFFRDLIKTI